MTPLIKVGVAILVIGITICVGQEFTCPVDGGGACIEELYPNIYNCTQYWSCSAVTNCVSILIDCPKPLEFSDTQNTCVDAADSGCTEVTTTTTTTTTTTPPPTTTTMTTTTTAVTFPPTTATPPPADTPPIGLYVAATEDILVPQDPLPLPEEVVNVGPPEAWNRYTNTLTCPNASIFFFHLNAGCKGGDRVNMNLRGSYNADIFRNSTAHTGTDTIGRDIIQYVHAGAEIYTTHEYTGELYSDGNRQTSFTAFELSEFMSATDVRIFSAARQTEFSPKGELPYGDVLVNEGGQFTDGSRFTADIAGFYFFTLTAGFMGSMGFRSQLKSNLGVFAEIYRAANTHNAEDMAMTSVMVYLGVGDYVYTNYITGELYSDSERQAYFGGFRYEPRVGDPHAWSVFRTAGAEAPADDPLDPMTFQGYQVNTGEYNFTDDKVHITQSGLYYFSLNMGVAVNSPMQAYIVRDATKLEAAISRSIGYQNGPDIMSQGLLVEASAGNVFKVVLGAGTNAYADADKQITFTGFMLYPYPF